jgi:thioredoxin-like negative regulator of GroEL
MDIVASSLEEVQNALREKLGAVVYFSTPQCNVCKVLRPKIMEMFDQKFPEIERFYVDSTDHPEISAHYNVFAAPTILVFLDGREFARESRNTSVALLEEKIRRPYEIMTS